MSDKTFLRERQKALYRELKRRGRLETADKHFKDFWYADNSGVMYLIPARKNQYIVAVHSGKKLAVRTGRKDVKHFKDVCVGNPNSLSGYWSSADSYIVHSGLLVMRKDV